ncbi:pumilio homolog 23-like [Magnolia sinica]|uniref:pumilio homolog 23-like n=1 Tax=Magnolia sinica TaxID=86752 RepID=UPI002658EDED|nr:pumilio homolog 23-like [Magnolia sinica]
MACFGSKVLQSRKPKQHNLADTIQMAGEDNLSKHAGREKGKNRRPRKEHHGLDKDYSKEILSGRLPEKNEKAQKSSKRHTPSVPQKPVLRKRVDPETAKYFSEIANLFEGGGIELEERTVVCGNALEETRGKELELATDMILSRILQTLLEGCDLDQLCSFLLSCAKEFPFIAMDKSGSHVAETALKSLALHLQDEEAYASIEETLTKICEVVVVSSVDVMCDRYGSHVLRSLLCLCKGTPLESLEEFHVTKSTTILAERLNSKLPPKSGGYQSPNAQLGFPHLLKFLVGGMFQYSKESIKDLCVNNYSSFVLQTALKLLAGDEQELLHVIPVLLGCREENDAEGKLIEITAVHGFSDLLKDTAYSHLMEVVLEVAPETLYDKIFMKVFKGSLFEISSHQCGSFVIQALVSSTRSKGQMDLIWEELGQKIKELLEIGKSGVVASVLAACERLHTHGHECCLAIAAAVRSEPESPSCIVPRLLFLESYFRCEEKSSWKWGKGEKMHTLGCLMLQTIFKYSTEFIQPYIMSLTSMEAANIFEAAKDSGGGRVIESFLCSDASTKQKRKVIAQLRGKFGELSMHPSGSFTVEKCFTATNLSLREAIASELFALQAELSKTKHGPYLLKKLDINGYAARPDQWKSKQASKQNAYKEFVDVFGSETKSQNKSFPTIQRSHVVAGQNNLKQMRKEIDQCLKASNPAPSSHLDFPGLEISMSKLGFPASKCRKKDNSAGTTATRDEHGSKTFAKHGKDKKAYTSKKSKEWEKPPAPDSAASLSKLTTDGSKRSKKWLPTDSASTPLKKQKR